MKKRTFGMLFLALCLSGSAMAQQQQLPDDVRDKMCEAFPIMCSLLGL